MSAPVPAPTTRDPNARVDALQLAMEHLADTVGTIARLATFNASETTKALALIEARLAALEQAVAQLQRANAPIN